MKTGTTGKIEQFEKLSNEVSSMRREIEDMKEILKGIIRALMNKEGEVDEDEFN
ncbi:MAG: hypothetical protein M1151_03290 [Candidatus Thermoplasmatota archaeon]|nr:hypothetical protein [Candidatus Thermoplasmatota archaeon]MCL5785679.1 hypothetical protein [Candidatus Thermoplasmatota archaeon]